MDRSDRPLLAFLALACGLLLLLLVLFALQIADSTGEAPAQTRLFGLLSDVSPASPDPVTARDREEAYRAREILTREQYDTLLDRIREKLSLGDFRSLDTTLRSFEEAYRDGSEEEGQQEGYASELTTWRADLALALADSPLRPGFFHPEVLAAAIAYRPISGKLDCFLDQDSACLPAIRPRDCSLTGLREEDLSMGEVMDTMADINARLGGENRAIGVRVFRFQACGHPCRLTLVVQASGTCAPYRLDVLTPGFPPMTVARLKQVREENRGNTWFDLDAFYAVIPPSDVDPRGNAAAP